MLTAISPSKTGINRKSTQPISKRLQSELMSFMMSASKGLSAFPAGDSLLTWSATVTGVEETPFEGLTYNLSISFTSKYPMEAPTVRFITPCYHPNVDEHGSICLDILKDKWSAVYNVRTILLSIQALLGDPNPSSPLNGEAASICESNPSLYKSKILAYHKRQAK